MTKEPMLINFAYRDRTGTTDSRKSVPINLQQSFEEIIADIRRDGERILFSYQPTDYCSTLPVKENVEFVYRYCLPMVRGLVNTLIATEQHSVNPSFKKKAHELLCESAKFISWDYEEDVSKRTKRNYYFKEVELDLPCGTISHFPAYVVWKKRSKNKV